MAYPLTHKAVPTEQMHCTAQEVADVLGVSRARAQAIEWRALKKLRQYLTEQGNEQLAKDLLDLLID